MCKSMIEDILHQVTNEKDNTFTNNDFRMDIICMMNLLQCQLRKRNYACHENFILQSIKEDVYLRSLQRDNIKT